MICGRGPVTVGAVPGNRHHKVAPSCPLMANWCNLWWSL